MRINQNPGAVQAQLKDLEIVTLIDDAEFIPACTWPTAYQRRDACFTPNVCRTRWRNDRLIRERQFGPVTAIEVYRAAINPPASSGCNFDHKPCVCAVVCNNLVLTAMVDLRDCVRTGIR